MHPVPPERVMEEEKRSIYRTLIYGTLKTMSKKIEMASDAIENCLRPVWDKATFINRGWKYGTVRCKLLQNRRQ